MKNFKYIFVLLFVLASCSSVEKKPDERTPASSSKKLLKTKKDEATSDKDVLKLDMSYSKGVKISQKKGRFDCKKYVNFEKEKWKSLLESAQSCIYDKDWTTLSKIADIFSHNHLKAPWGAYYKSLVASEKYKDYQRAEWMCNLALKKSPDNEVIKFQLARIYWKTERQSQAFDEMNLVRKKNSNNKSVLRFIGDVEYSDRNFKEALTYYNKITSAYSKDLDFRGALATSLFYTDQKEKSIKHYKFVAKNTSDKGPYYFQIAEAYKFLKKWELAKTYYIKAKNAGQKSRGIASVDTDYQNKIKVQLDYVEQRLKESSEGEKKNDK